MFENSVKIKPIVYRFPRMIWSVNQLELFGFFTDLGILTSASINLVFNKELLILSNVKRGTKYQSKQEKVCSTRFPVMSLTKILETFIRSFRSSFNRKYIHMVTWTVTLIRATMLLVLFPAVQKKNEGHAVALTDFYRFLWRTLLCRSFKQFQWYVLCWRRPIYQLHIVPPLERPFFFQFWGSHSLQS